MGKNKQVNGAENKGKQQSARTQGNATKLTAGSSRTCPQRATNNKHARPQRTPAAPTTYGYARVSSKDQNLARQFEALAQAGVEPGHVYADKASGKDFERPAYQVLKARLRRGDTLVVKSIDRLGRSYEEIIAEWRVLTAERGIGIVVLDMPLLDTRDQAQNPAGLTGRLIADIVLQLLSYVAQIERDNIRQRQAEGIASAHARGVKFGRPKAKQPRGFKATCRAYESGRISQRQAAKKLKVSAATFRKWVRTEAQVG